VALADSIYTAIADGQEGKRCKLFSLGLSDIDLDAVLIYIDKIRVDQELEQSRRFFTVAGLKRLLNNNGHKIGKTVISEHVRKVCACER
jgi:hypothetical protein